MGLTSIKRGAQREQKGSNTKDRYKRDILEAPWVASQQVYDLEAQWICKGLTRRQGRQITIIMHCSIDRGGRGLPAPAFARPLHLRYYLASCEGSKKIVVRRTFSLT